MEADSFMPLLFPGVGDGQGGLACCVVHGVAKSRTRLSD